MAPNINRTLANHFSHEILKHEDLSAFTKTFSVEAIPENLNSIIYNLLKENYKESIREAANELNNSEAYKTKVLSLANDVYEFFNHELPTTMLSYNEPLEVLCTLDICRFININNVDLPIYPTPAHEINVKIAINSQKLFSDSTNYLKQLYYFINSHSYLAFDFYDDSLMQTLNTIIIKDHMAILCAVDQYNRIAAQAGRGPGLPPERAARKGRRQSGGL